MTACASPYGPILSRRHQPEGEQGVHLTNRDIESIWTAARIVIDTCPDLLPEMQHLLSKCRILLARPLPAGEQEYGS